MANNSHFRCQLKANAKKDEAELLIYDEIGKSIWGDGVAAKEVVESLAAVTAKKIRVRINSVGGDVFEGLAIYNALRAHGAKIVTENDSLAASIASVLFLAGDERKMADNAFLMVHEARGGVYGTADDMRQMIDLLDKVGGGLVNLYVERTGQDEDQIRSWLDAETWFTAEEAKEAGFVTAITKGKKVEARADLSAFGKVPDALKVRAEATPPAVTEEIETPTADGDPAPEKIEAPNQPAAEAKGATPMSDQDKATLLASERARVKSIRAIGQKHNVEQALVDQAIDDESTVDAFREVVLAQIEAKHKAAPKINARVNGNRVENDPARGFENHREFIQSVIDNSGLRDRSQVGDERLRPLAVVDEETGKGKGELVFMMPVAYSPKSIRATAGSDEQRTNSDSHGGFAVPVTRAPGMLQIGFEGDPTAGLTRNIPMGSPTVEMLARTDKDHSSSVSGGFTVSRRGETVAGSTSLMATEMVTLKATSLFGGAYATEELLSDSPQSYAEIINSGFRDQFGAHILNEKLNGTGVGEYQGIISAGCTVSVAKETSQAAATINAKNVVKMAARHWRLDRAAWFANHNTRPQLFELSVAVGTGGFPIYMPARDVGFPDMLLGRPIFYTEYCKTLGTKGDIILADWGEYLEGTYQPLQSAESVHVRFLNNERVFKLWIRNAGIPWWRTALTPANGSTLSPFVTLDTRA